MKLNPLRYVADTIPRRGATLLGDAESAWDAAAAGAAVVRSSMKDRSLAEPALDLASIEREARAAQSAWIADSLKSCFVALVQKLSRKERADAEGQMAAARNGSGTPAEKASLPRPVAHTY